MKNQPASEIQAMFDAIAPRYDFLNHFLSLGIDYKWRKKAVKMLLRTQGERYLDLACGTGDVSFALARGLKGKKASIFGADFSQPMLQLAAGKSSKDEYSVPVQWVGAAAENLPFADEAFDGITVAFGVRNFANLDNGLREMVRVLKPGGKAVILEFSLPTMGVLREPYRLYFNYILPHIGRFVSNHPEAYRYLPSTVASFPMRQDLKERLLSAGFREVAYQDLTFGVVTLFQAKK